MASKQNYSDAPETVVKYGLQWSLSYVNIVLYQMHKGQKAM